MKLRRGENSSLPWCMAVHMFCNSEFNNQNFKNTLRFNCPVSGTYVCIFSDMNHLMLKLKIWESLEDTRSCQLVFHIYHFLFTELLWACWLKAPGLSFAKLNLL